MLSRPAIFCVGFACLLLLQNRATNAQSLAEKSIAQLIEQLSDSNVNERRDAAYELVKRGDTSSAVIQAYATATRDRDIQVQFQSFLGLAHAGSAAEPALDALLDRLDDRSDQIRFRAADAVGKIGHVAVQPILERWNNSTPRFKISACQAFEAMGSEAKLAVPVLLQAVQAGQPRRSRVDENERQTADRPRGRNRDRATNDPGISNYAAAALVAIDPHDSDALLLIASHPDTATRMTGISALAALPELSPAVLDRLRAAITDEEPKIREISLVVLVKSSIASDEKESLLESAFVDAAESVRAAAIVALRRSRLSSQRFAERLSGRLAAVDQPAADSLLRALSAVGSHSRIALPQLLACVRRLGVSAPASTADETLAVETEESGLPHELVVAVFAAMGPGSVVDLLDVVNSHPELESAVSAALTRIGQPALDALLAGATDPNPTTRIASLRALGDMQPLGERSLERLIAAINDPNLTVRTTAAAALIRAAPDNSAAQAAILRAMEDDSPAVRAVAVSALAESGFSRDQRRNGFRRALQDEQAEVRVAALIAIAKTPGQMQRHADLILEQTKASEDKVRLAAMMALANVPKEVVEAGQFGSQDAVQNAVIHGLRDNDVAVRIAATNVILKLELYSAAALEALGENLSGSRELIVATLEVLPKFQGDAEAIVARLQPLLRHELSEVRIAAVTALSSADRDPQRLTNSLVPMLEDREWVVRRIAGSSLGRQGSVAVSAVPKLFDLLGRHEDKDYAAESLRQIDTAPAEAIRLFIDNVDSPDRRKAFYAVTLLGRLGPLATDAIPHLEALLNADSQGGTPLDDFRRNTIKEALARIRPATTDI